MLQDTDIFDRLEGWIALGDVLPTVTWTESVSPDERYDIFIEWKFRDDRVGHARFIIEPIVGTEYFRLYWMDLRFIEAWQNKGLYTEIVKALPISMLPYGIIECVATPWDKEAERRLASQGFVWRGTDFVLDFESVKARLSDSQPF